MKELLSAFLLVSLLLIAAPSARGAVLELRDGSVVSGDILSLQGGVYTVKTASLGTVRVNQDNVKSVRYSDASSTPGHQKQIESLQRDIALDPAMMEKIMALQSDPQIQKALSDPEIVSALTRGDINTLMQNPEFMKLMNHPALKSMTQEILGQ